MGLSSLAILVVSSLAALWAQLEWGVCLLPLTKHNSISIRWISTENKIQCISTENEIRCFENLSPRANDSYGWADMSQVSSLLSEFRERKVPLSTFVNSKVKNVNDMINSAAVCRYNAPLVVNILEIWKKVNIPSALILPGGIHTSYMDIINSSIAEQETSKKAHAKELTGLLHDLRPHVLSKAISENGLMGMPAEIAIGITLETLVKRDVIKSGSQFKMFQESQLDNTWLLQSNASPQCIKAYEDSLLNGTLCSKPLQQDCSLRKIFKGTTTPGSEDTAVTSSDILGMYSNSSSSVGDRREKLEILRKKKAETESLYLQSRLKFERDQERTLEATERQDELQREVEELVSTSVSGSHEEYSRMEQQRIQAEAVYTATAIFRDFDASIAYDEEDEGTYPQEALDAQKSYIEYIAEQSSAIQTESEFYDNNSQIKINLANKQRELRIAARNVEVAQEALKLTSLSMNGYEKDHQDILTQFNLQSSEINEAAKESTEKKAKPGVTQIYKNYTSSVRGETLNIIEQYNEMYPQIHSDGNGNLRKSFGVDLFDDPTNNLISTFVLAQAIAYEVSSSIIKHTKSSSLIDTNINAQVTELPIVLKYVVDEFHDGTPITNQDRCGILSKLLNVYPIGTTVTDALIVSRNRPIGIFMKPLCYARWQTLKYFHLNPKSKKIHMALSKFRTLERTLDKEATWLQVDFTKDQKFILDFTDMNNGPLTGWNHDSMPTLVVDKLKPKFIYWHKRIVSGLPPTTVDITEYESLLSQTSEALQLEGRNEAFWMNHPFNDYESAFWSLQSSSNDSVMPINASVVTTSSGFGFEMPAKTQPPSTGVINAATTRPTNTTTNDKIDAMPNQRFFRHPDLPTKHNIFWGWSPDMPSLIDDVKMMSRSLAIEFKGVCNHGFIITHKNSHSPEKIAKAVKTFIENGFTCGATKCSRRHPCAPGQKGLSTDEQKRFILYLSASRKLTNMNSNLIKSDHPPHFNMVVFAMASQRHELSQAKPIASATDGGSPAKGGGDLIRFTTSAPWLKTNKSEAIEDFAKYLFNKCPNQHCLGDHKGRCSCSCPTQHSGNCFECPVLAKTLAKRFQWATRNSAVMAYHCGTTNDEIRDMLARGFQALEAELPSGSFYGAPSTGGAMDEGFTARQLRQLFAICELSGDSVTPQKRQEISRI